MRIFPLIITILTGTFGIYLGFRAFKNFRYMTKGEVSLRFQIMNSIIAGVSGVLIFLSIIMAMGFLDRTYIWTVNKFLGAVFVSLIPGVIIGIGSFIQAVMVNGYKRILHDVLRRKDKNE